MAKENKILLFKQTGGLYGLITARPVQQIADVVRAENRAGWHTVEIIDQDQ